METSKLGEVVSREEIEAVEGNTKEVEETTNFENNLDTGEFAEIEESDVLSELSQDLLYRDTIFNDLLGEFDNSGDYSVDEAIMQELIDMPKKIDYIDEEGIHARGFMEDRVYNFLVSKPVEEVGGNAYSFLKIDETIDRMAGFAVDTKTTIIATYEYTFDEFYQDNLRKVFNLKEYESDDTGEEGRAYRAENIKKRYEMLYAMREVSSEHYERLEEIYFNQRMLLLGMDPEMMVIMAEFSKRRTKLDAYFMISQRRFFFMNQLLDQVLILYEENLSKHELQAKLKELDVKFIEKSKEIKKYTFKHPKVEPHLTRVEIKQIDDYRPKKSAPAKQKTAGAVKKGDAGKSGGGKKKGGGKGKGGGDKKKDGGKKKKDKMKAASVIKPVEPIKLWADDLDIKPMADTIPNPNEPSQEQDNSPTRSNSMQM